MDVVVGATHLYIPSMVPALVLTVVPAMFSATAVVSPSFVVPFVLPMLEMTPGKVLLSLIFGRKINEGYGQQTYAQGNQANYDIFFPAFHGICFG